MNFKVNFIYHGISLFIIKISILFLLLFYKIQLGNQSTRRTKMSNQNNNHKGNQVNNNKGTSGTNPANAKVQGNKGKQMNPNQKK
jgi:hypothetical protein